MKFPPLSRQFDAINRPVLPPHGHPTLSFQSANPPHTLRLWAILLFTFFLKVNTLFAQNQYGGFTYALFFTPGVSDSEFALVSGYTGGGGEVTIPSTLPGGTVFVPVRGINQSAFLSNSTITSVTIPDSVTQISDAAFKGCTGLVSVSIGNGVTFIGNQVFHGCTNLTNASLPDSVTALYEGVFQGCTSLTAVSLGNGITSIHGNAFQGCTSLTDITIPNGVTSIGNYAFQSCVSLANLPIGNGVTVIGAYAYAGCTSLTTATIPGSVSVISSNAFEGCTGLTGVTIPVNVTTIQSSAFRGCTSLSGVVIPAGVNSIAFNTFYGCSGLTSLTIPNSVTTIDSGAFAFCTGLTGATIPNSVTSIGSGAFGRCTGLISVTIPDSVTSLGSSAFQGCTSLTNVIISNSITSIGTQTFAECSGLTAVTIPVGVTSIGLNAFLGCTGLTSVTIPNSVITIGNSAFRNCGQLTNAIFSGNAPGTFGSDVFLHAAFGFTIYYLEGSTGFTTPIWNGYPAYLLGSPIGLVASGAGWVIRNGVKTSLSSGSIVYQGDIIETDEGGAVNIRFVDDSTFSVSENARMVIDEFVFDPESASGAQNFSLLRGIFMFTSGLIGREDPDDVSIDTPIGSIGIRGTAFMVDIGTEGSTVNISLTVTSGAVVFENKWTSEIHEIAAGNSLQIEAPVPSLDTIRYQIERDAGIFLKLSGYTDAPFIVQRSINLKDWENWLELEPSDLPFEIDAAHPTEDQAFFRLSR